MFFHNFTLTLKAIRNEFTLASKSSYSLRRFQCFGAENVIFLGRKGKCRVTLSFLYKSENRKLLIIFSFCDVFFILIAETLKIN